MLVVMAKPHQQVRGCEEKSRPAVPIYLGPLIS
jgi:hypothetical protein